MKVAEEHSELARKIIYKYIRYSKFDKVKNI